MMAQVTRSWRHRNLRLEDIYRNRLIALVSPIGRGAGNVDRAGQSEIDFTRSEITEELMDPSEVVTRSRNEEA